MNLQTEAKKLQDSWTKDDRWKGIKRPYSAADVLKIRGSILVKHTLAELACAKLWKLIHDSSPLISLGAVSGNQAVQMVQAGLKAIYASGWQVAADANLSSQTYPDQSLYPSDSVPALVKRINNAFQRADQINFSLGRTDIDWFAPIVADAEAGFGGVLNAFELMKQMIESGAAAVHFEDQLSSAKKCGHMGGKVVIPSAEFVKKLIAARLAADVCSVPTLIIARTDALSAKYIANDIDPQDAPFISRERTLEGFYKMKGGLEAVIARSLIYAPYADLVWFETSSPDLEQAQTFAQAILKKFPGKCLAYNCSPSFNWEKKLDAKSIACFQDELGACGYKFQFVTLAGFHSLNHGMFDLATGYKKNGMSAYAQFQRQELASEAQGYGAVKHQEFVGTGYFDLVATLIEGGRSSTLALPDSTEKEQF